MKPIQCWAMLLLLGLPAVVAAQTIPNPPTGLAIDGDGQILMQDDFEYEVGRGDSTARDRFVAHGWTHAKSLDSNNPGARGYLYTVDRIPGYSGIFPGRNSRRALALEALPSSLAGQTDFYLQLGRSDGGTEQIPGNVWFQFWIYVNYYDDPANHEDQLSNFSNRNKFLYPCSDTYYPCTPDTGQRWHFLSGAGACKGGVSTGAGEQYICTWETDLVKIAGAAPENAWKMYQSNTSMRWRPNQWILTKLHFDTSGPTGTYEAWMRPMNGDWVKVAEWIGGVTPGLTWDIPPDLRGGHRMLRMPTTINIGDDTTQSYDSWMYLDDFVMATSEAALPVYAD